MRNQGEAFHRQMSLALKNSRNILLSSFTPVLFTLLSSVSYFYFLLSLPAFLASL